VIDAARLVAFMQTAIRQPSRLLETARREPLGMHLTLLFEYLKERKVQVRQ
jgi:hypothetical protein